MPVTRNKEPLQSPTLPMIISDLYSHFSCSKPPGPTTYLKIQHVSPVLANFCHHWLAETSFGQSFYQKVYQV